ncbi:Protein of unknown function, partial [Gryllus bimaculatus]
VNDKTLHPQVKAKDALTICDTMRTIYYMLCTPTLMKAQYFVIEPNIRGWVTFLQFCILLEPEPRTKAANSKSAPWRLTVMDRPCRSAAHHTRRPAPPPVTAHRCRPPAQRHLKV